MKPNGKGNSQRGVTRREFLGGVGAGIVGTGIASVISSGETAPQKAGAPQISVAINGTEHEVSVKPRETLLSVHRDKLGMTGTKVGCERGECGACTGLIDGIPCYSCLTLALEVEQKKITTIEGLLKDGKLSPVQRYSRPLSNVMRSSAGTVLVGKSWLPQGFCERIPIRT